MPDVSEPMQVWCTRVEGKLDTIAEHVTDIRSDVKDHESRLRALERKTWTAYGGLSLLSVLGGSSFIYLFNR